MQPATLLWIFVFIKTLVYTIIIIIIIIIDVTISAGLISSIFDLLIGLNKFCYKWGKLCPMYCFGAAKAC